jgi:hypothetical protein
MARQEPEPRRMLSPAVQDTGIKKPFGTEQRGMPFRADA